MGTSKRLAVSVGALLIVAALLGLFLVDAARAAVKNTRAEKFLP